MALSFWSKSTPLAVGIRTALFVAATSPVVIALFRDVGAVEDIVDRLTPAAVVVLNALLAGLAAGLLRYSQWWQERVQTPITRAVVQSLEHFVTGIGAVAFASLTFQDALSVGEQLGVLLFASIGSGLLALATNGAENNPPAERPAA